MTDPIGVLAVIGLIVGILALSAFCVWIARYVSDYRDLRRREAAYAEAWVRTHRAHQDRDRYITADDRRPE